MKIPAGILMLADPIPGAGIRKLAQQNKTAKVRWVTAQYKD